MISSLKKIIDLLGEDKRKLPILFVLFLFASLGDLLGIALIGPYISIIIDAESAAKTYEILVQVFYFPRNNLVLYMSIILVLVYFVKSIVLVLVTRHIFNFSSNSQARLRSDLMNSYQKMPYSQFIKRNSSEYIHATQELTRDYVNTLRLALRSASDGFIIIVICLFLAWKNPVALLILFSLVAVVIVLYDGYFKSKQISYGANVNSSLRKVLQAINEGIIGLKEIRILGKEDYFHKMVSEESIKYSRNHAKNLIISSSPKFLLEFLMVLFIVTIVLIASVSDSDLSYIITTLAIFGIAMTRVMPASNMITSFIVLLRYNKDGINKLHEHYLTPSYDNKVMTKKIVISNENRFEKISFSNVGFSYDDKRDYVTQKLSFDIQAGEAIGFIGASGSGKTTIIDLMLGLLKPTNGSIKYNDNELSECLSSWWSQVAYIPQEILLIDESIRTNIVLGIDEKEVDDDKLKKALKQARLFDFISQLPDGIETKIGEHGVRFSGGQKQRIALARAFYHDREVLILDEATSSLDSATEKEIVDEVRYLKGDKTLIIIAHRLTTLQHCDLIYEIEHGSIKNVHKYSDLIEH